MNTHEVKVVLMGDSELGVGKTSLVYSFVTNTFDEHRDATMGAGFMTKMMQTLDQNFRFQIWDTAGQEKYHSLAPIYFRDADVALLVYDVANRQSYEALQRWLHELKAHGLKEQLIYFVGNKIDLETHEVEYDEPSRLAIDHDATLKHTSAKDHLGVLELFESIASEIVQRNIQKRDKQVLEVPKKGRTECKC